MSHTDQQHPPGEDSPPITSDDVLGAVENVLAFLTAEINKDEDALDRIAADLMTRAQRRELSANPYLMLSAAVRLLGVLIATVAEDSGRTTVEVMRSLALFTASNHDLFTDNARLKNMETGDYHPLSNGD